MGTRQPFRVRSDNDDEEVSIGRDGSGGGIIFPDGSRQNTRAGETGPKGNTGPQGPTGPTGPQGAAGSNGAQGATGPTGPAGSNGSVGATGPTGPRGATGPAGSGGGGDNDKVAIQDGDQSGFLNQKLIAGSNITLTRGDGIAGETLIIAASGGGGGSITIEVDGRADTVDRFVVDSRAGVLSIVTAEGLQVVSAEGVFSVR